MDLSTFEDLLDRHGGDLLSWPAAHRAGALALLAASPEAQGMRAAMVEVEAVLRRCRRPADAGAVEATAARATRHRQETRARHLGVRAGWAAAAALVLALGLSLGDVTSPLNEVSPDRVIAAAFDAGNTADVD